MAIESSVLLDAIGRKLLAALQEDARLSYAELGRRIGLSPAATAERLRRLEEVGIITGYRVEIDREALGLPVMAIVARELRRGEIPAVLEGGAGDGARDGVSSRGRRRRVHPESGGGQRGGVGAGSGEAAGFRRAGDEHRILVAGGTAGATGGPLACDLPRFLRRPDTDPHRHRHLEPSTRY